MKSLNTQTLQPNDVLPHVARAVAGFDVKIAHINPEFSDTALFCETYGVPLEQVANCVIVKAKRGSSRWFAAVLISAHHRADINGAVRKLIDARSVSFAPMDRAVELTGMEYGGIGPFGLPADWQLVIDEDLVSVKDLIIGSGKRDSKLVVGGKDCAALPSAVVASIAQ